MIKPGKHLNLNVCVLRIAVIVLSHLQRYRLESCTALIRKVRETAGEDAVVWFLPALDFLFLLGQIDYHAQTDTLEYRGLQAKGSK